MVFADRGRFVGGQKISRATKTSSFRDVGVSGSFACCLAVWKEGEREVNDGMNDQARSGCCHDAAALSGVIH